jgi:hypothetical protein
MAETPLDDTDRPPSSSTVSITVLSIKPVKFGKIFALASVEVDIDGALIVIHEVRAMRAEPMGTRIDLPVFRDENGMVPGDDAARRDLRAHWQSRTRRARRTRSGRQRSPIMSRGRQ